MIVKATGPKHAKIMLIGEAPGADEEATGIPFVGGSGKILNGLLRDAGISREECFITNIMQVRPVNNDFGNFYEDKGRKVPRDILLEGIERLKGEIVGVNPNVIVAFGNEPLKALTGLQAITKRRGSLYNIQLNDECYKVIPTMHPAAVMRFWEHRPLVLFDLKRVLDESADISHDMTLRTWEKVEDIPKLRAYVKDFLKNAEYISFDIETCNNQISCISFARTTTFAFTVPIFIYDKSFWTPEEELIVWQLIKQLLESSVKKIAQNANFDMFFLWTTTGIKVKNLWLDTMNAFHDLYPELPKDLGLLCSIYTDQPYYKDTIKTDFYHYNCLMKRNMIILGNGTTKSIEELVKDKYTGDVLSYNVNTQRVEPKKVTGHIKYIDKKTEWLRIKTDFMGKNERGLIVTPDHGIYTQRGMVEAATLQKGDRIITTTYTLTPYERQVILGTVLGDGHLSCRNGLRAGLIVEQKSEPLIKEKAKYLCTRAKVKSRIKKKGYGNKPRKMYELTTPYTSELGILRRELYKNNTKVLGNSLSNLGTLGLAMWYMDDGCLANGRECRIAIQNFSGDKREEIRLWFEKRFGVCKLSKGGSLRMLAQTSVTFCEMIGHHIISEMRYKLPPYAPPYKEPVIDLPKDIYSEEIINVEPYRFAGKGRGYNSVNYCLVVEGNHNFFTSHGLVSNCLDSMVTFECALKIEEELKDFDVHKLYHEHTHLILQPLLEMQVRGHKIDMKKKVLAAESVRENTVTKQEQLDEAVGYELNVNSPKQMKSFLYSDLGLPPVTNRKTGKASTDEIALRKLNKAYPNPIFDLVIHIRGQRKLLSTYLEAQTDPDGRFRCRYVLFGTETGRLSSKLSWTGTGGNLQNVPKGIAREIFIPDEGKMFMSADLSQAELRVVAYLANEQQFIKVFEAGRDVHRMVASHMFSKPEDKITHKERELGKRIVHASNYGMGAGKLAELSGMSYHESEEKMNLYHVYFPKIRIWHMDVEAQLKKTRVLTTPMGRKRMFFGRWNKAMLRDAYSYVPQSTVADLTLRGMVNLYNKLSKTCNIVFNIHDEVVIQVPVGMRGKYSIKSFMVDCMSIPLTIEGKTFTIPVGIKTGMNWNEVS